MTPSALRLVTSDVGTAAETHDALRERALTCQPSERGLARVSGRPVWGIVMETGSAEGVTTLVTTDDGAVSLFSSGGGDSIHLKQSDWPYQTGARLIGTAGDCLFDCVPAWAFPLPDKGKIRFYLLTFDGVMTAEALEAELAAGGAPLSALYYAGHDVLTLARLVSGESDWAEFGPADEPAEAPAETVGPDSGDAPEDEAPASSEPSTVEASAPAEPPRDEAPAEPQKNEAPAPSADEAPAPVEPPRDEAPPVQASGRSLLQAAAKADVDAVTRLLAEGHDLGPDATGLTPLMAAAYVGALEPLSLLLAAGASVDLHDSHGFTALMFACNAGHFECACRLLEAGSDLEARDGEDSTPIIFAAQHGYDDIVRLLLECGADPTATSKHGLSAIGFATRNGFPQTVAILLGQGG
jgi:hypothetical protein